MKIHLDFETYSEVNIKKAGAYKYATHPSTKILSMSWAQGDEDPHLIDFSTGLHHQAPWFFYEPQADLWAWNALFEMLITQHVLGIPVPLERWNCSMALGAYNGYPLPLVQAAKAVGKENKDQVGNHLIRKCCIPGGKPTAADYAALGEYCRQDVRAERSVHQACPVQDLVPFERSVWEENIRATMRGVPIDQYLVSSLQDIRHAEEARLEQEMISLVGFGPTKRGEIARYLGLESIAKEALEEYVLVADDPLKKRVAEIRLDAAKTSTAKLDAIQNCLADDGAIHGMTEYYAAHTGRFGGRLVQLQNLPRGSIKITEGLIKMAWGRGSDIDLIYPPLELVSSALRGCLVAEPGKQMYAGDYSQIEARVIAWLAGCQVLLDGFADPNSDLYTEFGARHGLDRQGGKTAILGLGFQMGGPRFHQTCIEWGAGDIGEEKAKEVVQAYRTDYHQIPAYWKHCMGHFMAACKNPGKMYNAGAFLVGLLEEGGSLIVKLPSGRHLVYPGARTEMVEKEWEDGSKSMVPTVTYMGKNSMTQKWERKHLYGGRIVENLVQAIARDIMATAMIRLAARGFELLFTVHDEIVVQGEPGREDEFIQLMATNPPWCQELPTDVEGGAIARFRK